MSRPVKRPRAGQVGDAYACLINHLYTRIANHPERASLYPTGRSAGLRLGYPKSELERVPRQIIRSFVGVGYPLRDASIDRGSTVLDVGAGSGTDAYLIRRRIGPRGKVWALDRTRAMLARLSAGLKRSRITSVVPLLAPAENIPLPDSCVDVVTSNGVLNLLPEPLLAIAEIFRILRGGGTAYIADIVFSGPLARTLRDDGAVPVRPLSEQSYVALLSSTGFGPVRVSKRLDYFSARPLEVPTGVRLKRSAYSIELIAQKPKATTGLRPRTAKDYL